MPRAATIRNPGALEHPPLEAGRVVAVATAGASVFGLDGAVVAGDPVIGSEATGGAG